MSDITGHKCTFQSMTTVCTTSRDSIKMGDHNAYILGMTIHMYGFKDPVSTEMAWVLKISIVLLCATNVNNT